MDSTGAERPWERRAQGDGRLLIRLSWAGTLLSCVTAAANALTGSRTDYALSAVPALVMLAAGSVVFLWAFAIAVQRSREETIAVGGLFFLAGCAPAAVQRSMMASVAVQTLVPLGIAIARPFTAFAVLAPVWSLGLAGLWGARHGTFPARVDDEATAARGGRAAAEPDGPECDEHDDPTTEAPTDG